jgi:NADPH:quinone reductase-like Zn-dependent oxidoreductase
MPTGLTHKRVVFTEFGGPDRLHVEESPAPRPADGEVLVRVAAAAVNHLDLDLLAGIARYDVRPPHILGMEAAGTVEEVGPGVIGLGPGARVMVACDIVCYRCAYCLTGRDNLCPDAYRPGWTHPGAYAELMVAPARGVYLLPDNVTYEDAAALQIGLGTAWHMLVTRGRVQAGEWVLVNGAAGSIGLAAIHVAKLAGARVVAASASPDKRRRLLAEGADAVADYSSGTFVSQVREAAGGHGVDLVYEHVGGDVFTRSLQCLREGGRLVTCGAHGGEAPELDVIPFFRRELTVIGSNSATQADIRQVLDLVSAGRLRPVIWDRFPLAAASEALGVLVRRGNVGRVLILPNDGGTSCESH